MEILAGYHSLIIHFPIAFFFLYAFFELTALINKTEKFDISIQIILSLAVFTAVISVFTGNQAMQYFIKLNPNADGSVLGLIDEHEKYATFTVFYFLILLIIRSFLFFKKKLKRFCRLSLTLAAVIGLYLIYETGIHGGELVFKYGVGTEIFR